MILEGLGQGFGGLWSRNIPLTVRTRQQNYNGSRNSRDQGGSYYNGPETAVVRGGELLSLYRNSCDQGGRYYNGPETAVIGEGTIVMVQNQS